jgi:hypothetical protein
MGLFENRYPPPPLSRVAQSNQIAAQKTPWLVHSNPRLTGNVGSKT